MEKKQYDLCLEVLRRLKDEAVLDTFILVGSWCILLYADYFKGKGLLPPIRTRDLEFLIPIQPSTGSDADLPELLRDLGFVADYKGEEGYMVLAHPDLILEFLVPAHGREPDRPHRINRLGINAQPLRFMDLLSSNPIRALFRGVEVTIPHPANFALQKLLIARRRKQTDKAGKDRAQAVAILKALKDSGEFASVSTLYHLIPASWQRTVRKELTTLEESSLLDLLAEPSGHA